MRYQVWRPAQDLSHIVRCYWMIEADSAPGVDRVLPDGCSELVFHFADVFDQVLPDGGRRAQEIALAVGQMRESILLEPRGRVRAFGIRFWPGGAWVLCGIPQAELTNRIVSADDVMGSVAREWGLRIAESQDPARTADFLLRPISMRRSDPLLPLSRQIVCSGGNVRIDDIVRQSGIGARQLRQRFREVTGVGPKMLARIVRFQIAAGLIRAGETLVDGAIDAGYYDQAHFQREFREFAGITPRQFRAEVHPMGDYFADNMSRSESVTPSASELPHDAPSHSK